MSSPRFIAVGAHSGRVIFEDVNAPAAAGAAPGPAAPLLAALLLLEVGETVNVGAGRPGTVGPRDTVGVNLTRVA